MIAEWKVGEQLILVHSPQTAEVTAQEEIFLTGRVGKLGKPDGLDGAQGASGIIGLGFQRKQRLPTYGQSPKFNSGDQDFHTRNPVDVADGRGTPGRVLDSDRPTWTDGGVEIDALGGGIRFAQRRVDRQT